MKTQIKELDKQFYELDNMCNSCSNPLPIFDNLTITKRANRYEERLEQTLFFTRQSILSELEKRIIKNFK